MIPYSQHLKTLIASKSLREELTTWTLSKDSNQIQEEHRGYLVPVVIRLLMPKVIKLKTLASRKVRTKLYLYLANMSQHIFMNEILSIQALLDLNDDLQKPEIKFDIGCVQIHGENHSYLSDIGAGCISQCGFIPCSVSMIIRPIIIIFLRRNMSEPMY